MGNIDDQHRNPNMNNKDNLVGRLTRLMVKRQNEDCEMDLEDDAKPMEKKHSTHKDRLLTFAAWFKTT